MSIVMNLKQKLKHLLTKSHTHFIWAKVGESYLYLLEIKIIAPDNLQIISISQDFREADDECFYEECLHKFTNEHNLVNLPIYLALDDDLLMKKTCCFPLMDTAELDESIAWECSDFLGEFVCSHTVKVSGDNYLVTIYICARDFTRLWQGICRREHLDLLAISNLAEAVEYNINVGFEQEILPCRFNLPEVISNLQLIATNRLAVNLLAVVPSKLRWQLLYTLVIGGLIAVSLCFASFCYSDYYILHNKNARLVEKLQLLQADKAKIEALQAKEQVLAQKRERIKAIYAENSGFYPLLVSLGSSIHDGVQIVAMNCNAEQMTIEGKAVNYEALSTYKQQLSSIKLVDNVQMANSSAEGNLIAFTLKLNEADDE